MTKKNPWSPDYDPSKDTPVTSTENGMPLVDYTKKSGAHVENIPPDDKAHINAHEEGIASKRKR